MDILGVVSKVVLVQTTLLIVKFLFSAEKEEQLCAQILRAFQHYLTHIVHHFPMAVGSWMPAPIIRHTGCERPFKQHLEVLFVVEGLEVGILIS